MDLGPPVLEVIDDCFANDTGQRVGSGVIGLALAVCFWLLKIPVQLSEWKISVDNKAAAATLVRFAFCKRREVIAVIRQRS